MCARGGAVTNPLRRKPFCGALHFGHSNLTPMQKRQRLIALAALAATTVVASCGAPSADPRMVSEWMHALYGTVRVERLSPPVAARVMTYASSALYAGMAVANPRMRPIAGLRDFPQLGSSGVRLDETITAVVAERVVLDSLFADGLPTSRASLSRLADSLVNDRAANVTAEMSRRSREVGEVIGLRIVEWSHTDGFDSTRRMPPYMPPVGPGLWINDAPTSTYMTTNLSGKSSSIDAANPANVSRTADASDRGLILSPPKRAGKNLPATNMAGVTEPYWGTLRPFALNSWDECPAPPAPAYGTAAGTPLYDQAKVVFDTKTTLTPEQKTTVLYWADNGGESGTPAGHWLAIAAQIVSERKLSGEEAARIMLATSVALSDGFVATWGYKFKYNLVRPRTFIRQTMDATWEPTIPTPPFPEYMSGHSSVSAAAATALTQLIGSVEFTDSTSVSLGHTVRHFKSFLEASDEAGQSRVYGGIHYPVSNEAGKALGRCIGAKVVERLGR